VQERRMSDSLTKSLPRPAFEKHRVYGGNKSALCSIQWALYASVTNAVEPLVAYVIEVPTPMYSKKAFVSYCACGQVLIHRGRAKRHDAELSVTVRSVSRASIRS